MKYSLDLQYNGIEVDVDVKAQNKGDQPINAHVNVPGNISVKVTGECGFWETFMYFSFLGDIIKTCGK